MAGFSWVARTSSWRTRAVLVVVVVAAAGTLAGVAGATPTTSTTNVSFVPLTVPHKVLNATYIGANASNSPVVSGGSTTVPTDATTVRIDVSAKGAKAGTLSFYPSDNASGGSGQTLGYPAGNSTVSTTIEENVGLNNKITVVNTGAGAVTVTATITGYSTQVTAGEINGVGGTAGQVLTDNGTGGASWTDVGHAYSVSTGFFVMSLNPGVPTTLASLTVPAGTYAVSLSGTYQSGFNGRTFASCSLKAPSGAILQSSFAVADSNGVNDQPITAQGVMATAGGTLTEVCTGSAVGAQAGNFNLVALRVGGGTGTVVSGPTGANRTGASSEGLVVR